MSYDPIESAAKGATEGLLKWGESFIKKLASKFRSKELAFIFPQYRRSLLRGSDA